MASNNASRNVVSVDEQAFEQPRTADEADEVVEDGSRQPLRPTVDQAIQAKVDANHPDAGVEGLTLAAEERVTAREHEIERTAQRFDRRQDSDREVRCRQTAAQGAVEQRRVFEERVAAVDRWQSPEVADPREQLSQDELGAVNREARRLAREFDGWSRAAIGRLVAERVGEGMDVASAVVDVAEQLRTAPGTVIPIGALESVDRQEVRIRGEIKELWTPSSQTIQQVGLIADDSGRTKFTIWRRSNVGRVEEGQVVELRHVARNWYQGRCSVALTGRSRVRVLDHEDGSKTGR